MKSASPKLLVVRFDKDLAEIFEVKEKASISKSSRFFRALVYYYYIIIRIVPKYQYGRLQSSKTEGLVGIQQPQKCRINILVIFKNFIIIRIHQEPLPSKYPTDPKVGHRCINEIFFTVILKSEIFINLSINFFQQGLLIDTPSPREADTSKNNTV